MSSEDRYIRWDDRWQLRPQLHLLQRGIITGWHSIGLNVIQTRAYSELRRWKIFHVQFQFCVRGCGVYIHRGPQLITPLFTPIHHTKRSSKVEKQSQRITKNQNMTRYSVGLLILVASLVALAEGRPTSGSSSSSSTAGTLARGALIAIIVCVGASLFPYHRASTFISIGEKNLGPRHSIF